MAHVKFELTGNVADIEAVTTAANQFGVPRVYAVCRRQDHPAYAPYWYVLSLPTLGRGATVHRADGHCIVSTAASREAAIAALNGIVARNAEISVR